MIGNVRKQAVGAGGAQLMPSTKKMIETHLIEFLKRNRNVLNRFYLPEAKQRKLSSSGSSMKLG